MGINIQKWCYIGTASLSGAAARTGKLQIKIKQKLQKLKYRVKNKKRFFVQTRVLI